MKLVFGSCACSVYLCDNTATCCSICELQQEKQEISDFFVIIFRVLEILEST